MAKRAKNAKKQMSKKTAVGDGVTVSKTAGKLIERIDEVEALMEELREEKQKLLEELVHALGGYTFDHPDLGPTTVMCRKGAWFWRPKPGA